MALYDNGMIPFMKGLERFWAEWDRYTYTHERVNYNWFRRLCRRCGLKSMQMRCVLHINGHIESYNMPCVITRRATVYHTYDVWQAYGCQVQAGETSYYRNSYGVAVFSDTQVCPSYHCSGEFLK